MPLPFMYILVVSTISWYTTKSGSSRKRTELGWMKTGSSRSGVCQDRARFMCTGVQGPQKHPQLVARSPAQLGHGTTLADAKPHRDRPQGTRTLRWGQDRGDKEAQGPVQDMTDCSRIRGAHSTSTRSRKTG